MATYETRITIRDPKRVVLEKLPFEAGQEVRLVITEEKVDRAEPVRRWEELFKLTQALPQAQTITEDEIAAEIEAYRAGH